MQVSHLRRRALGLFPVALLALLAGASEGLLGVCGSFTDTANDAFCGYILEVYYLAITTGTTPTTFDPGSNVTRTQIAAFLSRTVDRTLQRSSRRAALKQFWTPQNGTVLRLTTVGANPFYVESDGADLWVTNNVDGSVSRVRGSDGRLLETWTGANAASGVLVAVGQVFVTGENGRLYQIDPSHPAGVVTTVASNLPGSPLGIAFDGSVIWTTNVGLPGSVSIITPGASLPWTVTTVTTGFTGPLGMLYDGANVWVTNAPKTLLKLNGSGAILPTVTVGLYPQLPVFDGTNIWVPNGVDNSISVVRDSTGAVLSTLTGNGLSSPSVAAFDGQRVLVTNSGDSVSLWKAADLTPIGSFSTGASTSPYGACSDGVNFWIILNDTNQLARF